MKLTHRILKNKRKSLVALVGKDSSAYMNPLTHWIGGLSLAIIVFLGGIVVITIDFYRQLNSVPESVTVEEQPVVYNEKDVRQYAESYIEKERVFNELRRQKTAVPFVSKQEAVGTTTPVQEVIIDATYLQMQ